MERRLDRDRQEDGDSRTIRRVPRSQIAYVFGPNLPPALVAGRGETILFETHDCYTGRVTNHPDTYKWADAEERNPVTGPVFVEGAEVGDVLCVQIQQIRPASKGVAVIRPRAGILGPDVHRPVARTMPIVEGRVEVAEGMTIPVQPVIGVIGVASRHGEISTRYPGRHGGNMDTQDITAGARVYLPVQVKGALLALGDVKACMGDGETSGTGVEVAAEVTVRVDVLPGGRFAWPRLENNESCITVASASSVKQAARLAVMEMVRWLEQDREVDFETAYLCVGLCGDLRVSQWVNPLVTARVVLPRAVMTGAQPRPGLRAKTARPAGKTGSTAPVPLIEPEPTPVITHALEPTPDAEASPPSSLTPPVPDPTLPPNASPLAAENEAAPRPQSEGRRRRWRKRRRPVQNPNASPGEHREEPGSPPVQPPQVVEGTISPPPVLSPPSDAAASLPADEEPQTPARPKRRWRWRRGRRTPSKPPPT